ncbi:MAG: V-type ATP synthase subunit F [Oscillospiraceae bacterium]|nr:V-type ATP synthase subunit F [Oscillospiraceae bacterium]
MLMFKIGVMGGPDTVIGFKALGLDTFAVDSKDEAKRIMNKITDADSEYAIIYLEENLAEALSNEIKRVKDRPTPAIILIPGREGSIGLGQSALKAAVERAVGTNILGD